MDLSVYKEWSDERIEYELSKTPIPPLPEGVKLLRHQKIGFLAGVRNPKMILRFKMGLGKSITSLLILNYLIANKMIRRGLILAPRPLNIGSWVNEAQKFSKAPVAYCSGSPEERQNFLMKSIRSKQGIVISDYYTMNSVFSKKNTHPKINKNGKKDKNKYIADIEKINEFSIHFDAIVLDEIHKNKNQTTLRTHILTHLTESIYYRYGLTGTLFDKSPVDIWSQFNIINRGKTLGSFWYYQKEFFVEKFCPFTLSKKKYVFNDKKMGALKDRINRVCLSYNTEECIDVPPITHVDVPLPITHEHINYYDEIKDIIMQSKGNLKECEASFVKMRLLLSSLIPLKDEDLGGNTEYIRLSENPKLEWILEFLDNINLNDQVIIFHDFIESGNWIAEELKRNKITYSRIYGGTKDKESEKAKFLKGETQVMIGNNTSISEGFNLQNAAYSIFYETPISSIIRAQAEMRSGGRIGSVHHTIYDLYLSPSLEKSYIDLVKNGISLHQMLTSNLKEM